VLLKAGAEVLRKLDAMGYKEEPRPGASLTGGEMRRKEWPVMAEPDDELEEMIATYRKERQEKSAGFCPKCGKPLRKSDQFCSRCGTSI
jgi:hypothetical protein